MKEKCNLFLLLLFLFVGVKAAKANVESFDFTKMGFSDDQQINEVNGTNITITFGAIAGTKYRPYWNNNYHSVVVYDNVDSCTIAANHPGYKIWQIVITFSNKTEENYIRDTKYVKVNIGKLVTNKNITTWTGGADNVTFTNLSNYHEWWIQKIDVYYSVGGDGKTAANPYTVGDINTFSCINWLPSSERYIRGIVSQVGTWDPSSGTISYHLSDNGIDTAAIVVKDAKYLNRAAITGRRYQIARGDTLTVYGTVSNDGNQLVLQSPTLESMNACKDQITIKAAGWATYVSHRPIDFSKTQGVQAFQTTFDATSNTIVLSPITAIPENTAVVLKGAKGSYTFENTEKVVSLTSNELTFFTVDTPVTEDRTVYVLACKQGVCGFFPLAKGESMPSYKGYLLIKNAATPKPFYRVGTTPPTAIRPVEQRLHRAVRYNLAGERVDNNYKGVVIENGRKIIVK